MKSIREIKGACLISVFGTVLSSCGPLSYDPVSYGKVEPSLFSTSKMKKDVMPIGAWAGPDSSLGQNTREQFHNAKEAGLNFVFAGLGDRIWNNDANLKTKRQNIYKSLEYAEEEGLLFFPVDYGIEEGSEEELRKYREEANYESYSSFGGLLACDEPAYVDFKDLAAMQESFYSYYPKEDYLFYINMNPTYVPSTYLSGRTYETYINDFVDIVKNPVLSYDHYPELGEFPHMRDDYFLNLDIISYAARTHKVPFWNFVLLSTHGEGKNAYRDVTEKEIKWQIGTSLAYGVKGIQYFCFMTPNVEGYLGRKGSIVNEKGERSNLFDAVKNANSFLSSIDEYVMDATPICMFKDGKEPVNVYCSILDKFVEKKNYRDVSEFIAPEGAMCSVMARGDKTVYLVTSNSIVAESPITLKFNRGIEASIHYYDGKIESFRGGEFKKTLPEGEPVLIVVEN
ncbi:MAG: hypothetical protein MJ239_06545 [Bacilli bacterium]|nr:hypothetical protein [Bacilli bacterium]